MTEYILMSINDIYNGVIAADLWCLITLQPSWGRLFFLEYAYMIATAGDV